MRPLFLCILILVPFLLNAQTIKTDVLVVGGSASGVAAAIQCGRSKVKTILADDGFKVSGATLSDQPVTIDGGTNVPSGIWAEFRRHILEPGPAIKSADSAENIPLTFAPGTATSVLKKISDTVKNLTVYQECIFTAIKKDGDYWEVKLTRQGKALTVRARVVVDGTAQGMVAEKAGAKVTKAFASNAGPNFYRTSIACGELLPGDGTERQGGYPSYPAFVIPLGAVVAGGVENLLTTAPALPADQNIQSLPAQLQVGQGAGATAAFCAFFKTTTKHLNVRVIQGELLDFKAALLPFADIDPHNQAWRAVQQVSAAGLLKGRQLQLAGNQRFVFMPDSAVTTAEVQPVLTEIYTRAFLWFGKEKPGEKFTVGNTLSFISEITLTDPQVLQKSMQKAWTNVYKFKSAFDLNRGISRYEFAVLANRFLNPFARTVDMSGRLVN